MNKSDILRIVLLNLIVIGSFIFIGINNYKYANISYDDLVTIEGEFSSYIDESSNKEFNIINLSDGKKIGFKNNVIADEEKILLLDSGCKLSLLCLETKNKNIDYELIEIKAIDNINVDILVLNDYHTLYSRLFNLSFIISFCLLLVINFFLIYFPKLVDKSIEKKFNKKIDYDSEKAKKYIEEYKSIVRFDGLKYYANLDKVFDKSNCVEYFCKFMDDKISENEILCLYSDDEKANEEVLHCLYKNKDKIALFLILKNIEKINEWFIDDVFLCFSYPQYSEFTENDMKQFEVDLESFSKKENINIVIEKD